MLNRNLTRVAVFFLLMIMTVSTASALSFKDLSSYQKQQYWKIMKDDNCLSLLSAGKQSQYRACALNVFKKASEAQENTAWCKNSDPASDTNPDFFKKGIVTSNLYPNGIEDYIYVSDSTSYMMKGFCSQESYPHYAYYSKNCAEFGPEYSADASLGVCVKGNTAPVLNPIDPQTVVEGDTLNFNLQGSDVDAKDTLSYSADSLPAGVSLNQQTGAISFSPNNSYVNKPDTEKVLTFNVKVSDGNLSSEWTPVKITVYDMGQAPLMNAINPVSVNEGANVQFTVSGTDSENDILTFDLDSLPAGATFDKTTGLFSYSPDFTTATTVQKNKVISVKFKAFDGKLWSDWAQADITVVNINQAPLIATVADQTVSEGSTLTVNLNGTDTDGDTLTYSADVLPAGVTLDQSSGVISFSPAYTYIAHPATQKVLTFNVKSTDGELSSAFTSVKITVNDKNQAPVVTTIPDKYVAITKNITFTVTATDPDGDAVTGYDFTGTLPAGATFNKATGVFTYSPISTDVDTIFNIPFTATDGKDISASQPTKVIVTKSGTPAFGYAEKTGNPTDVKVGNTITKYFYIYNYDKVRYINVNLEAMNFVDYTKYINPLWISYPDGKSFTIQPLQNVLVKVNLNIPLGGVIGTYIMATQGILGTYGGSQCTGGCVGFGMGVKKNVNILP